MAEFFCCCRYILTFYPLNSLMSILLPPVYFLIPCSKCHLTKKIEVEAPQGYEYLKIHTQIGFYMFIFLIKHKIALLEAVLLILLVIPNLKN